MKIENKIILSILLAVAFMFGGVLEGQAQERAAQAIDCKKVCGKLSHCVEICNSKIFSIDYAEYCPNNCHTLSYDVATAYETQWSNPTVVKIHKRCLRACKSEFESRSTRYANPNAQVKTQLKNIK